MLPLRRSARLKKCRGEGNRESCTTLVPYLHHDIWFDIFLWFSALCLYNIVKRVCKSWATIISHPDFVDAHLRRSTYGIFIRSRRDSSHRFLEIVNNNVEITEIDLKIKRLGQICSTYRGVMLFRSGCSDDINYVINPVTRQIAEICGSEIPNKMNSGCQCNSVICDRRSGEYKVVRGFYNMSRCGWYVKKLGSGSKWDKIIISKERFRFPGLGVGGFLCYASYRRIIIFDVSDETVHEISWPEGYSRKACLPMGNAEALSSISFDSERIFIHVLTDLPAGKWSLYHIVDNQSLYRSITGPRCRVSKSPEFLVFLGWINNNEELVGRLCTFRSCSELGSCYKNPGYMIYETPCSEMDRHFRIDGEDRWIYFAYNPKTKHTRCLSRYISQNDIVQVHTNSLVSW